MSKQWRIIGGGDKGGILVRDDDDIQFDDRLKTGAIVNELDRKGDKLKFSSPSIIHGPREGWITIKIKAGVLAEPVEAEGATGGYPAGDKGKAVRRPSLTGAEVHDFSGGTAWNTWRPMPENAWSRWPRAGPGDKPPTVKVFKERVNDVVEGEFWGIKFPFTPQMFREWGPAWLTSAMHTVGTLPTDNEITEFAQFDVVGDDVANTDAIGGDSCDWGGAGPKVLLSVKYKNGPTGECPEAMFVKFPHEPMPKNERTKLSVNSPIPSGWCECMFYNTLGGRLPLQTPRGYFCDMSRRTTNYILVTERIAYGSKSKKEFAPGEILPPPSKYRDWALPNAVDHYYAHSKELANFFAWSRKTNGLTDQVKQMFTQAEELSFAKDMENLTKGVPWDKRDKDFAKLVASPPFAAVVPMMGFGAETAKGFLAIGKDLMTDRAPHVFPQDLVKKSYLDKFFQEAEEMAPYCAEMTFYMKLMPEYEALAHPNAQVDNAYYWRDEAGKMAAGLLDWDGCTMMPMPQCVGNAWMGAEPDMLDEHEEKLLKHFLDEYKKASGEELDYDSFYMCYQLSQVCVMYGCFANLGVLHRLIAKDQWKDIKDRFDQKVDGQFLVRCYLVQVELFLAMWRRRNPYPQWQKWMKRTGMPKK